MTRYSRSGRSRWVARRCGCRYWFNEKRKLCRHDVVRILRRRSRGMTCRQAVRGFPCTPKNIANFGKLSWRDVA